MNTRRIILVIALLTLCATAGAEDFDWNGRADFNHWYWFNPEPGQPGDPVTWANNWGETIVQPFGGDPPTFGSWNWPGGTDNVTIDMDGAELHNALGAAVTGVNVGLGGRFTIFSDLQCVTLNTAGIVDVGHDCVIYQCAIQNSGGTGVLRSVDPWNNSLPDAVLHDVIISVPVEIPGGNEMALLGDIQLNDVISLLGGPDSAQLRIDGDVTLSGSGWIETTDDATNSITANGYYGQVFTNQSTIYAAGDLGYNQMSISNEALIVADRTTMLILDPEDVQGDGHPGVINTGTLRATDGATLRLNPGTFENVGGVIEALDGSVVELFNYATVTGGTLQTSGTGEIRAFGVDPVVKDLTVTAGSSLVIPEGKFLKLDGAVTIDGELRLESAGGTSILIIRSPVSLSGAGEVVLTDSADNRFSFNGVEAGNRLTTTIPIRGATGSVWGLAHGMAITNHSTITADGVNPILIDPNNTTVDGLPGVVNDGTLQAVSGSTMMLAGGTFDNMDGVIEAQDGSTVELGVDAIISGGTLLTAGTGIVRSTTAFGAPRLSDLTMDGRLESLGGTHVVLGGTIVNDGVIESEGYILPFGELTLDGAGELRLVNGAQIRPDAATVANGSDHTIRASGAALNYIHRELILDGNLEVEPGASLRFFDSFTPVAGSSTHVDGTLQPSGTLLVSGQLSGAGTVNGAVDVTASGILSPGSIIGTLTTGNLIIENGAAYRWQTSSTTGSDLVDVTGELNMGAATMTVKISVLEGPIPDRVVLFSYNTLASTPALSQFSLTKGYEFTGIDTSNNELVLTGVSNPTLIFDDEFETGDIDRWSSSVGSTLKSLAFEPDVNDLNIRLVAPSWVLDRDDHPLLVDGRDIEGETVVAVEGRDGVVRAGVRCADGWIWSDWNTPAGFGLEVVWKPGQVWLYDARGLVVSAVGDPDDAHLTHIRAHSIRNLAVQPTPATTR